MQKNSLYNWLKLSLAPGIGTINAYKIYQHYPDLDNFFESYQELKLKEITHNWLKNPDQKLIEKQLFWIDESTNQHLITIDHPAYPNLLKQISNPPIVLFVHGNLEILDQPQIAIVGSRNASSMGIETSEYFAKTLAEYGWLITSGLASGIDSGAHRGVIQTNKQTLAVMGTGINKIYPSFNHNLAKEIIHHGGCLISEFPLDSPAHHYHFPQRNRIISALTLAVIVIEASLKSGSLITAKLSNDYNREVFATPGSIYDQKSQGCNQLISEGANIVLSLEYLINELKLLFPHLQLKEKLLSNHSKKTSLKHPLLEFIDHTPKSLDEIVLKSKSSIQEVQSELTLLEISGHILFLPDGQVVKKIDF